MSTPPPPPPPDMPPMGEDPFASESGLSQGAPTVAANPGRMVIVLLFVAVLVGFLFYNLFFSGSKKKDDTPQQVVQKVAPEPVSPPPLPTPEAVAPPVAAPPTFTPIDIPEPTKVELIKPQDDGAEQKQRQARMRSNIMVTQNSGGGLGGVLGGGDSKTSNNATVGSDQNSQFASQVAAANTTAEKVEATRISDLRRTIAQGRIIHATLESALNTDLPAPIRAIVSRDVYGEAGNEPLIPKGSRLIGTYNTSLASGQSRVFVVWTRVIRPDGVDVMLNSPLVDQIGQAGVGGQVDTHFQEMFSRSVMSSLMSIAFAIGSDKIAGGSTTTTSSSTGTSTTGDAASTATINALNRLGSVTDGFLQRFISVNTTILVDQGTPVNVFVNRDLIFPSDVAGTRVIN